MSESQLSRYAAGKQLLQQLKLSVSDDKARKQILHLTVQLLKEASTADADKENRPAPQQPGQDYGPQLGVAKDLNLLMPRGKFSMGVHQTCLHFSNAKTDFWVSKEAVRSVVIIDDMPEDTKNKVMVVIALQKSAGILHGKTILDSVLIQTTADAQLDVPMQGRDDLITSGTAIVVLCSLLGSIGIENFVAPDPDTFLNNKGGLAMRATHKVHPGWLFPLPGALCFIEKPTLVIEHENISWISLQRIDRLSSTFDIVIHYTAGAGAPVALDQIDRAELGRFHSYLSKCNIKTEDPGSHGSQVASSTGKLKTGNGGRAAGPSTAQPQGEAEDDDDSDDLEDEDFDPEGKQQKSADEDEAESSDDESVELIDEDKLDQESDDDDEGDASPDAGPSRQLPPGVKGIAKRTPVKRKQEVVAKKEEEEEDIGDEDSDDEDEDEEEDEYETEEGDDDGDDDTNEQSTKASERDAKRAKR